MKMSYFRNLSSLLMVVSAHVHADNWEHARSQGQATVAVASVDNLFNSVPKMSSTTSVVAASYDWLGLYEGFGVQTPVSVSQHRYAGFSELNNVQWQAQPAARFFLSDASDLTVFTQLSRHATLAGEEQAEFVEAGRQTEFRQRAAGVSLQIGHAPELQNFSVQLESAYREQHIDQQSINEHRSKSVHAEYSVRIGENMRVLASSEFRDEEIRQDASKLTEAGVGLSYQWTAAQQFRFVAGAYRRSFEELTAQTGQFWQLNNQWDLNDQWQLSFGTSRHSVLSQDNQALSQLQTEHKATIAYRPWQQHQLQLAIAKKTIELEQQAQSRAALQWQSRWLWQVTRDISLTSEYRHRALTNSMLDTDMTQNLALLQLGWQW